jgi:hypothetical protein
VHPARIHFLGGMTEPEVAEVVDGADAFVLASSVQQDGDTDGTVVALMGAMAADARGGIGCLRRARARARRRGGAAGAPRR